MSDKELIEKIEDAYRRVRKIGPDAIYETELREVLRAAAALRDYAEVLRDLEEHGPQVAWEALQEARDPEEHDDD